MVEQLPTLRLENNGDVIDITNILPNGFLKLIGAQGFGVSPTKLIMKEGAGEGLRWRRTKRLGRTIDLPIAVQGQSRSEMETMMRRLIRLLNDTFSTATLYIHFPGIEDELFTAVHYSGGLDPQHGKDTNRRTYVKDSLTLVSESPYWTSTKSVNYSLTSTNVGRGLLKSTSSLSKLRLSSSSTIGTIQIENPGDVEAFPVWTVTGPGDSFTAVRSLDSATFAYNAAITNLNPITIDTRPGKKTVKDLAGVNKYGSLGNAPKLFSIPVGLSQVSIALVNSTGSSRVAFYFQPRYELVL